MNCQAVRDRLLQGESLQVKDWPRNMNRHLKECPACAKLARSLFRLEAAWRDMPTPKGCEEAKETFLQTLADAETIPDTLKFPKPAPAPAAAEPNSQPAKPKKSGKSKSRRRQSWRPVRWTAAAAMILIGISAFAWLLSTPNKTQAKESDIIDRLIDWNLHLANSDPEDRKKLRAEQEAKLVNDLMKDRPNLSSEEYNIAWDLLENGRWLADNDDPFAEAEHVTDIANKLANRAAEAEKRGDEKVTERCGIGYDKFMHYGVKPMQKGITPLFSNMSQWKFPEPKKDKGGFDKGGSDKDKGWPGADKGKSWPDFNKDKGGFDKAAYEKYMLARQMEFQRQLALIWARSPEFARPDFHRRFDGFHLKGRGPGMLKFGRHR